MPKRKFHRKVKDFDQISNNMRLIDDYIRELNKRLSRYSWGKVVTKKRPGGGTPPPPPLWP